MQFAALNVDFDGLSLDFLGLRKPAHEDMKERYPVKVVILPLLASLSWKKAADRHGHAAYHNKH